MSQSPTPHRSEHEIDRLMASAAGPVLVVATAAARLETANKSGRAWIGALRRPGLADPETPRPDAVPLDPAMPAVKRLRDLADTLGPGSRCSVTLTFWTSEGVRTTRCDVAFIRVDEETLAVVELGDDTTAAAAQSGGNPPKREAARQLAQSSAGAIRDDAAILKEIARRIREGQNMHSREPTGPPGLGADLIKDEPSPRQPSAESAAGESTAGRAVRAASDPSAEAQSVRIAKLAHELKTPLSAIVAAAEIMRDERLGPIENPRYRSYAADIFDSARHALMVIGNMLGDAAAGIDFDQSSSVPAMVFTEVDLNAVAESCVSSMRPLADAAGLALSANLADGLPHVIADSTAVRQIALNLLTNAVKFSPAGGEIRLGTRYDCDGRVELLVRDTGRGMTDTEIAKAEAPHERTALSRREGGGLGIGLPLVGALARANGANITITSEPLRGTTVTVSFAKDRVVPV